MGHTLIVKLVTYPDEVVTLGGVDKIVHDSGVSRKFNYDFTDAGPGLDGRFERCHFWYPKSLEDVVLLTGELKKLENLPPGSKIAFRGPETEGYDIEDLN